MSKAPASAVRNHFSQRVQATAFDELRRAALEQVLQKLEAKDKPFLPPEVVESEKVKLKYGAALEFAVSYMVDPTGISGRPEQPDHFNPLAALHPKQGLGMPVGVPTGPKLPTPPGAPQLPQTPQLPAMAQQQIDDGLPKGGKN